MNFQFLFDRFFSPVPSEVLTATELYKGEFNPFLVILSGIIPIVCAYIALSAVGQSRISQHKPIRIVWMIVASFTMGVGVWSMHFVGMLSFELPCIVEYDSSLTFLSILPSMVASLIALSIVRQRRNTPAMTRLLGGVFMAAGIATMHYAGMAAMRMEAVLYYDVTRVGLSVLLAVSLAWMALSLPSYLLGDVGAGFFGALAERGISRSVAVRGMSAFGLGLAVTSMHYTAMWAAMFKPEQASLSNLQTLDPDFLAVWIMLAVALMATAVVGIVSASKQRMHAIDLQAEVALRRRVEIAVEEQRARLQAIIDNVVDGIITINAAGIIQHWSPAAQALFGYSEEEVTGQNVSKLMAEPFLPDEIEGSEDSLEAGKKESRQVIGIGREAVGLRKDGSTFPLDLSIGHGEVNGKPFYTGVMRDLTQRKQELELLEEARDNAQQAVKAKSEFLANMSHEIRTPMNGVMGFLGLALEENGLSEEVRSYLKTAQNSANNLLVIIDDILDFSRLESGRITLEAVPFDIHRLVREAVQGLSLLASDKVLTMSADFADDVPALVTGDPTRIRQILINLVSNAIKFTHEGRVSVRVSRFGPGSQQLLFAVTDTGIGMSPETLDRVFQPFEQADTSTHRVYGGTGLGTTISLQLAQLHGGDLWAESEVGKGTTFFFTADLAVTDGVIVTSTSTSDGRPTTAARTQPAVTVENAPLGAGSGNETSSGADRATLRRMFEELYEALDEDNPDPVGQVLDEMTGVLDREFITQMRKSVSQFDFGRAREKADLMLDDLHLR